MESDLLARFRLAAADDRAFPWLPRRAHSHPRLRPPPAAARVHDADAVLARVPLVRDRHPGDPHSPSPWSRVIPKPPIHDYQAVIVGAGGAGLWAALELARSNVKTAVLTKLYP